MKPTIAYFSISVDDVERARAFYKEFFGWEIERSPAFEGAWTFKTGDEGDPFGWMHKRWKPEHSFFVTFQVQSVREQAAKAEALGCKVIRPVHPLPGVGWSAALADPEGNEFGIVERDESAA
jgi:hypothetical protein